MSEVVQETRYDCDKCGEWFEDAGEAIDCCPSEAHNFEVYICTGCDIEHLNRAEAEKCCEED